MVEWTYKELKESVYEDIEELEENKQLNYLPGQIAGRCFYENTVVITQGYTESIIVHAVIGKYIINKCSKESIINYSNRLITVLKAYDRNKLDGSLTEEEMQELESDIKFILEKIEFYLI